MSKNSNYKRNITKCYAVIATEDLVKHTLTITANENIFKCRSLAQDISHEAERAYICAYSANNVHVCDTMSYEMRAKLEVESILHIKNLLALIDLAWHIEHLRGRKVEFWISLSMDALSKVTAWHKSIKQRYKQFAKDE